MGLASRVTRDSACWRRGRHAARCARRFLLRVGPSGRRDWLSKRSLPPAAGGATTTSARLRVDSPGSLEPGMSCRSGVSR